MRRWIGRVVLAVGLFVPGWVWAAGQDRPNILWLSFEDTSATNFACYGNVDVKTPVVDDLARRGILFDKTCSVAPYCSPARSTLISGCFATTYGTDIHRQKFVVPGDRYVFPVLMRGAGYYCTNNQKTDYNAAGEQQLIKAAWDESSPMATYNNPKRKEGQPFFAVFNNMCTHMTRVHTFHTVGRRKPDVDPATVHLPPFVPDLPEIRADYALHLEGAQDIDKWVATFEGDLAKRGLAEDTIIFLFSDHAGVLPRGKAFPYETGLRPVFIMYVPPKWQKLSAVAAGTKVESLVGFEDFAPTVLTLAGVKVPGYMEGRSFLAEGAVEKKMQFGFRSNTGHHYDPIRWASDGRYTYLRSYTPYKPLGLRQGYQWGVPGQMAWDKAYHEGKVGPEHRGFFEPKPVEQLFDTQSDPWEMHDLAQEAGERERLGQFREAVAKHMRETKDLGLFPRSMRDKAPKVALYDWVRQTNYPVDELIAAAELASVGDVGNVDKLVGYLKSDKPEVRFWGTSGYVTLAAAGKVKEVPAELVALTKDPNDEIASTAAEALCRAGRAEEGLAVLAALLKGGSGAAGSRVEELGTIATPIIPQLEGMENQQPARSVLINLGKLPYDRFFGPKAYAEGLKLNAGRMEWRWPSADPEVNARRPKEAVSED